MRHPNAAGQGGFTLVEMVVTVAIVAVLALMVVPLTGLVAQRAKEQELRTSLRQIREAIDAYKQAADEGRIVKAADASGYPAMLELLVDGVEDARSAKGARIYFLRRLPRDPMHPDPAVPAAQTWGKRSYASPPDAPEEGEDVFDVHSLAEGAGLNGIAYREW